MKKIIVILIFTGLALVALGYYFSEKSSQLIAQSEKETERLIHIANDEDKVENSLAQLQNNTMNHQYLELNQADYNTVNPCLQDYINKKELPSNCDEQLLKVIIDDFGEEGMINGIIGESINYSTRSFNHIFFNDLFTESASLKSKLILSFLNKYRNPERLGQIFNKYKYSVCKSIPKSVYQKIFDKKLASCIAAYEEIASKPDKEAFYKDIYFKADSQNLHGKYWNITFWKRRALEKNDKTLYAILKEIKAYYDEAH